MGIVAAMGLGLALTTSLEPQAAANYEAHASARSAAEAGIAVAVHELAGFADWNQVLRGEVRSALMEQGDVQVELPDGTRAGLAELTARATCGRPGPCPDSDRRRPTSTRPWGANNPSLTVFGHFRLNQLIQNAGGLPATVVVVWVGDDPAEADGEPLHDSGIGSAGAWQPGGGVLIVRAEAFGPRFAHHTLVATVARPDPAGTVGARLVSLRVLS